MCDKIYEDNQEFTDEMETDLQATIYRALLYKVGKIDHSFCKCCCMTKFRGRGPHFAEQLYKNLKLYIYIMLFVNVLIQLALTTLDQRF